ncbi:MAG: NRDE family protein [Deltaproteobacteria bacterium]|nr:NRDE family protein [Deltaproteobacteria bacterium]
MCTLILYFRVFSDYPIVIAANRDEVLARPSSKPSQLWGYPWVYGGQDLLAGGTWFGVNEHGVAVGILNRQSSPPPDPSYRSRGQLCLDALKHASAEAALRFVTRHSAYRYNPFNLVIADQHFSYVVDNQGQADVLTTRQLSPGMYVVTNRTPNDQTCPRIARVSPGFADIGKTFTAEPVSLPRLFSALHQQMADHGDAGEGIRNGLCLHLEDYGTCSSTLVAYSSRSRSYHYYFAEGPPCRIPYSDVSLPPPTPASHPPSTK